MTKITVEKDGETKAFDNVEGFILAFKSPKESAVWTSCKDDFLAYVTAKLSYTLNNYFNQDKPASEVK